MMLAVHVCDGIISASISTTARDRAIEIGVGTVQIIAVVRDRKMFGNRMVGIKSCRETKAVDFEVVSAGEVASLENARIFDRDRLKVYDSNRGGLCLRLVR